MRFFVKKRALFVVWKEDEDFGKNSEIG